MGETQKKSGTFWDFFFRMGDCDNKFSRKGQCRQILEFRMGRGTMCSRFFHGICHLFAHILFLFLSFSCFFISLYFSHKLIQIQIKITSKHQLMLKKITRRPRVILMQNHILYKFGQT